MKFSISVFWKIIYLEGLADQSASSRTVQIIPKYTSRSKFLLDQIHHETDLKSMEKLRYYTMDSKSKLRRLVTIYT